MKSTGLVVLISLISSTLAIVVYDTFFVNHEPQILTVNEKMPAQYTNFAAPQSDKLTETEAPKKELYYQAAPTHFTEAAQSVRPTVVNIKALQNSKRNSFDDFWGSSTGPGASSGSGVVISQNGYIVTNHHVIENANKVEVTLSNNRSYTAKVIGTDPSTDLALIKINKRGLDYIKFGDSDLSQIGEWVLAVGNPFNLSSTVTAGIISAKGRNINILEGQYKIESFIQTDAAVNPGNSGGALVNTNGELIGINTAIITQSGRYEGYSFAVPANLVKKIVDDLREFGVVQRGFLGVTIEDLTEETAKSARLTKLEGVYISQVNPNSAADDGGIRRGDIITHINGVMVKSMPELQEQVARYRPGDKISTAFIRDGKKKSTQLILKDKRNKTTLTSKGETKVLDKLGFQLRELTSKEKDILGVKTGIKVISVRKGSKIDRTNLTPGFVITKVNDVKVKSVDSVVKEIQKTDKKVMLEGIYEDFPGEYYYAFAK